MAIYTYADEAARKKAAGIPLNNGVIPKTTTQANKTVYNPMSASQAGVGKAATNTVGGAIPGTIAGAAASGVLKQAQGMSASQAGVGTTSQGAIPPIYNAATNTTGKTPDLGYGSGGTYGKTAGLGDAYKANTALISTETGKQSEISRTQAVIAARKAAGLDTSGQEKYLKVNLGYDGAKFEDTPTDQPTDYDAIARAEVEKELSKYTSDAEALKGLFTSDYNRANQITQDGRTMDRLWVDRNASPFTGQTIDKKDNLAREWSYADESTKNAYLASIGKVDSGVFDYTNSVEDSIKRRADELRQRDMDNARADAGLTGNYNGGRTLDGSAQDFSQMDKNRYYAIDESKNDSDIAQRELENAYAQAEITGVIGPVLGKKYGLPPNTPTQAVKESNRDYALDQAKTSADIANTNNMITNRNSDNARIAGNASSGGSGGSNNSEKYNYKTDKNFLQEVALSTTDPAGLYADMVGNAQEYIDAYGIDGYTNLWNRVKNQAPKK